MRIKKIHFGSYLASTRHFLITNKWAFIVLLTLPLVLFFTKYIITGNMLIGGDFDYYAQMYEASRISILEYGQFPSWNPWMSGGIPLYANPQFGLFSIQSLLGIPFGTIYGLKLSYVIYAMAGFWGMYTLGRKIFNTGALRAGLIGYVWVFCGFFAGHNIMHYTFSLFFLLPWLIICIYFRNKRLSWLWLGLLLSLIMLSSIHYALLMTVLILMGFYVISLMNVHSKNKYISIYKN